MILRWQQGRDTVDELLARGRLTPARTEDAEEALPAAAGMVDAAARLLDQMPAY